MGFTPHGGLAVQLRTGERDTMTDTQNLEARVETLEDELGIDTRPPLVERVEEAVYDANNVEESNQGGIVKVQYGESPDLAPEEVDNLREDGLMIERVTPNYVHIVEGDE